MKKDIRNVVLSFGLVLAIALGSGTVYAKKSEMLFEQDVPENGSTIEVPTDLPETTIVSTDTTTATDTKSVTKITTPIDSTQTRTPTPVADTKSAQYQLLQNQLAAAKLLQEELDAQKAAELQAARDAARRASRRSRAS